MDISSFDDLLRAARAQPEPQRLLFVFAGADLPEDSTPEQRARFEAGLGGALTPLMSVDKDPEQIVSFAALVDEARLYAPGWAIVFVAGLAGREGRAPGGDEADRALQQMIASIKSGMFRAHIPFDRAGQPVVLG